MRKRPSVPPHVKPYRIAVLLPLVAIDGPDAAYEREAALLLWAACLESCRRQPQLAVLDLPPPLVRRDGHFVPDYGAGGVDFECAPRPQDKADPRFAAARRDDVIWLEFTLGPRSGVVRLHSATRDAGQRAFDATGRTIGQQIREALAAWLTARGHECAGLAEDTDTAIDVFDEITADDVFAAARMLAQVASSNGAAQVGGATPQLLVDQLPFALRAPALRILELVVGQDGSGDRRSADSLDPRALYQAFDVGKEFLRLDRARHPTRATEETVSQLEAVAAIGMAVVYRPDSIDALEVAADRLVRADRFDEALRFVERAVRLHRDDPRAHLVLLRTLEFSDRLGSRLAYAMVAMRGYGCPSAPGLPRGSDQIEVDLRASSALVSVGRIDEAIALRADRLRDREASWPGQARLLERWQTESRFLAQSYAREAYFRGDVSRVLEGFSRTPPADSVDLTMLVESLVAVGRPHEAALAWAQFGLGHGHRAPVARLAAAKALVAAGQYRHGLEELWRAELTAPGSADATAIARCGVVLAAVPLEVIEAAVGERMEVGAVTLARRMARTVADYVPAAATSAVIERALAKRTPTDQAPPSRGGAASSGRAEATEFDPAWLAGFSTVAGPRSTAHVDKLFVELGPMRSASPGESEVVAELARGDRLVTTWLDAVLADASTAESHVIVRVAAYAAAQALSRYLAATTFPASPIAGALRTVAAEALALVHVHRDWLADEDARAVLHAIEPVLRRVDRWVGTAWLAIAERCLAIDERAAGDLAGFCADVPTVAARVLGPEETALLSWSVARLHRERRDGWAAKASAQASRLAMHTGNTGLEEWADATVAELAAQDIDSDDAIDSLQTACYLAEGVTAGPCVCASLTLFAAGRAQTAFDVLAAGFATASDRGEAWRAQQLSELRDAWLRANLDVPFDVADGTSPLFEGLRNRDPVHSERLGRWAIAMNPSDSEAHRHLGLALAAQRNTVAAMHHLVRSTRDQAAEILVVALNTAGFLDEAKTVLSYASRWGAEVWPDRLRTATPANVAGDVSTSVASRGAAHSLLELGDYPAAAAQLDDASWRVRTAALAALRFRTIAENHVAVTERAERGAQAILAETVGTMDPFARVARALALRIREQAHFARDPLPVLGDRITGAAFDREFRIRSGESVADEQAEPVPADRVVLSTSSIARISDYVALLGDLAHLPPDEALAQFDLDAAGYLEVARAWAAAMEVDPTIQPMVEAGLAKR